MQFERSISSYLTSNLVKFRQPYVAWAAIGDEEAPRQVEGLFKYRMKAFTAQLGFCLLMIASSVETIAYASLAGLSLAFSSFSNKPYLFFAKRIESSFITFFWNVFNAFMNPFLGSVDIALMNNESSIRYIGGFFKPLQHLFREEDHLNAIDWFKKNLTKDTYLPKLGEITVLESVSKIELINQGASFIVNHILKGTAPETKELFEMIDQSIIPFVIVKAVYIYTYGSKAQSEIPNFFNIETKEAIRQMRKQSFILKDRVLFENALKDLPQYNKWVSELKKGTRLHHVWKSLNQLIILESKNLFTIRCWKEACINSS